MLLESTTSSNAVLSENFTGFLYDRLIPNLLVIFLFIVVGSIVLKTILKIIDRNTKLRLNGQTQMLIRKTVKFVGIFIISILVLNRLEVPLSALLGTAGIATVAIGIASQNSMGNLISGIFLLTEQSFQVGDIIEVGEFVGTVTSVDLLSVKLKTFDGLHMRIPNETLIRSEITTITKYPVRRVPLKIGISYYDDIEKARDILFQVAENEPLALDDPKPFFMVSGYGSSSIDLLFGVWGNTTDYAALKSSLLITIKEEFDKNGIEIPFPHLTLRPAVEITGKKEKEKGKPVDISFEEDSV